MEIEAGKSYRTRDGRVFGPMEKVEPAHRGNPIWVWRAPATDSLWLYWREDGSWAADKKESPMDLIAEAESETPEKMDAMFGRTEASRAQGPLLSDAPMTKHRLLDLAKEATADRGLNYGKPEDNFARIAEHWNAHLANIGLLDVKRRLTPTDVALMCALLKVARLEHQPAHQDSWIDLAGYAACGAEIALGGANSPVLADRPWIEWRGGNCPVDPGMQVEVMYRSGATAMAFGVSFDWDHHGQERGNDIIAYRVVR